MAAEPMETKPTIVCLLERAIEKASKRKWRRPHLHPTTKRRMKTRNAGPAR
jgi:hypothetical protein